MDDMEPNANAAPDERGWICPFCGTDCSPIAGEPCVHFFLTDGENGWRFSPRARTLFDAATAIRSPLFRDLLYHDAASRAHLRLRRAIYDDSLEIFVFSSDPSATTAAFEQAITGANEKR